VSTRAASAVAWTLFGVSAVLGFAGTGMSIAVDGVEGWHFVANDGLAITIFLVSGVVGALVASRLPGNPIGWIFVGLVVCLGLSGAADGYVELSVDRGRLGGLVPWAAWYSADVFLAFFATLLLALLLFPDGRPPSRRWRVVLWAGGAGFLLLAISVLFQPGKLDDYPLFENPAGTDNPVVAWVGLPGLPLFLGALVASAASLVVRFRRARGVERQQLTLLMAAGILATCAFVASWFVQTLVSEDLGIAVVLVGVLAIPVAIGVAMLRYRLYEIDRVISRTLVYGALTVILGAAYAGLVLAGQAVFSSVAGGGDLAIAVSTLVVAALFLPLRARVQRLVDRRFYRRRYDAQRTLESFGARLREQVALDVLAADLRAVVDETVQPAHASLWRRSEVTR
jgi:hypothetical protein